MGRRLFAFATRINESLSAKSILADLAALREARGRSANPSCALSLDGLVAAANVPPHKKNCVANLPDDASARCFIGRDGAAWRSDS